MTVDSINPENVYALVVGIEKYKAGSEWDLNGPSNDALKFADWLLDRGVKSDNIQLFLSPLDGNMGVLEDAKAKGLTPIPAYRDRIDQTIRQKLTSVGNQGDLLYVFWGGHGIITKTDTSIRRLFFADSDKINKWNLNFNSLVEALSSFAHGSGFTRQNFFIDACANSYYQGLYQTIEAESAATKFSTNGEQGTADQFVLFASAEYQVATNENELDIGMGKFSRVVLDGLQGKSLLPDMKALAERIHANCVERQNQLPVYWWISNGGNDRVIENNKPSQPSDISLTPKQMKDLHQALLEAFPDESDLEMLVKFYLQTQLNHISTAKKYDKVVFDVIQFVNSRGKVRDLLKGALDTNPNSPFLSNLINYLQ